MVKCFHIFDIVNYARASFFGKDFIHSLLIMGKGSSSVESPSYSQPFLQK